MEQMQQNARSWLLLATSDHNMNKTLQASGMEVIDELNAIASRFSAVNPKSIVDAEKALLNEYEQLVTIDLSVDTLTEKYSKVALQLREVINELQEQQINRQAETSFNAKLFLSIVSLIALIFGIAATIYITKLIATPLHETAEAAARIAQGDLTNEIKSKSKDEVGKLQDAIGHMTRSLKELIGNVSQGITEISSSASQLSVVTEQNRQGMRKQHEEIEQVAAAMNEMTMTVHDVAKNAEHAAEATSSAQSETVTGNEAVGEAIKSVEHLCTEVDSTSLAMDALAKQSNNIGTVLEVIKSVADQTNLLALNAAIEAARAGEAGRGFAVVADEVRSLAQRTQQSTSEIESMIQQLQLEAHKSLEKMASSKQIATANAANATAVGTMFERISNAVDAVQQMNHQIATAAEEQSVVAEEINRRITQVKDIADQTADSSQETASATERLATLGIQLQSSISGFRVK